MGGSNLFPGYCKYKRYTYIISDIIKEHEVTYTPMTKLKT